MTLIRRNPLLAGFGAGAAPAFVFRATPKPTTTGPGLSPGNSAAAKAAAPTPAQVAATHRQQAQRAQNFVAPKENYADQATLSREARAAAQDRLTTAAMEYETIYGGGGGTVMPTAAAGSGSVVVPPYSTEEMPTMNATAKARAAFITWLRDTNPEGYRFAMQQANANASLADTSASTGFDWQKFIEAATAATTAVFQTKAQKDMLKVNIERAKAGLPPMDTSFAAPVIRTQFDVSPEVAAQLQQSAQAGMMNIALIGGIGLVAFMLLRKR